MDPLALAQQLIALESVNPSLDPHGSGERQIAEFCAQWLITEGFEVTVLESSSRRPSVVGVSRGAADGPSLMLCGHLDTVGVSTWPRGLAPVIEGDRIIGRGAYDMKAGLAAILVAAATASRDRAGDLIVALVADEEFGSLGAIEVLSAFRSDAAIIAEPSELELTVAHRGFGWFEIDVLGRAAHGSMPHEGVDAIAHARRIMAALDDLGARLAASAPHPFLAPGTVRISMIRGGVDAATVAPSCTLTVERRFLPGETPDAVEDELREALGTLLDDRVTVRRLVARGAFESPDGSEVRRVVGEQVTRVTGRPVVERGEPFWTDAGLFAEAGIPSVLVGVAGGGAHADDEWASIESIHQLTEVLRRSAEVLCGVPADVV